MAGDIMFGFTAPVVRALIERLPNAERCAAYRNHARLKVRRAMCICFVFFWVFLNCVAVHKNLTPIMLQCNTAV
jgi:hypothetical protein